MEKKQSKSEWSQISLLGVKIDTLSLDQLLSEIRLCVIKNKRVIIAYVNIHAINIAFELQWFRKFLNQSYCTFCDGIGVKLAARLTRQDLQYRFTPPDFIEYICEHAIQNNWKIFFLGAKPGVAQAAAELLVRKFPALEIDTYHGYFNKKSNSEANRMVVKRIIRFQPHILVLGFGMPLQEKWIAENIENLDVNILFPAGALFDYLAGYLPRAPRWMTDYGLEWLGRLIVEPRRLWKRYLIGNPLFFWRIFVHHILRIPLPF